jgi:nitroreductase
MVPKAHLRKILEITCSVPTAGNQQPWKFLVVRNQGKLDELKNACIDNSMNRFNLKLFPYPV